MNYKEAWEELKAWAEKHPLLAPCVRGQIKIIELDQEAKEKKRLEELADLEDELGIEEHKPKC